MEDTVKASSEWKAGNERSRRVGRQDLFYVMFQNVFKNCFKTFFEASHGLF